ncbi:hypothetical protein KR059_011144 [Drosophila kikkawai]|nr:hypothetical protein KR059_011144 [Drosophila kikkawai]
MTNELPPIILKGKELIKYRHLKRKYPVSQAFLHRNWWNAKRFITYALRAHCVLRTYAWRRRRSHRVRLVRRVRILLFDPRLKGMIKRRLQNVRQWSSSLVGHYKKMGRIEEYEEMELYSVPEPLAAEEVTKQMKEQLELLKSGKRGLSLMEDTNRNVEVLSEKPAESDSEGNLERESETTEPMESASSTTAVVAEKTDEADTVEEESNAPEPMAKSKEADERTPKKSSAQTTAQDEAPTPPTPSKEQSNQTSTCSSAEKQEKSEKAGGSKFLDMLISKVRVKTFAREDNIPSETSGTALPVVFEDDGSEDFVGFDESVHQPGMLLTPLVPQNCKTLDRNSAFVSDTLDAYMREHYSNDSGQEEKDKLLEPMGHDGQVTSHSMPPPMDMPAVPEALQRLRTVAERRQYLQRCKNQKMAIINNEANIYRELQRKQRQRKVKIGAMQALQAPDSQMPFTRQGWQAASYVATENSKYYYQVMQVDGAMVRLPGARGNNLQREKNPYLSHLTRRELASLKCSDQCMDARIQEELTVIPTEAALPRNPKILNQFPLPAIFRPCPLSKKPLQRPLDDDTAALLLAGGSMAVVSMPNVQLDVMPEVGRPLDEIAKRYLQHILPHHDITREWAEFSVSTLQQPPVCMKDAEEQASQTPAGRRKSFTFVIPYLNDRNHILVRRVVDRSEELDASFNEIPEKLQEFTFRSKLPLEPDSELLACADMINDMINTVAISCSENSFISEDPDAATESSNRERSSELGLTKDEGGKESEKLAGGKTKRLPNKQKRLANELRRLNATIIDAAARNADANKPCIKDHCQLGCLCASLAGTELPLRDHCGRPECVLECRCLGADQARVMRVEAADGLGISNDEAFNLRRKATARLAKMEKDFTSTLVLCDNETLLINDSQGDKKRRCTKAPKRYEDFDDTDMFEEQEIEVVSPTSKKQKKLAAAAAAAAATAAAAAAAAANAKIKSPILKERCTVKDTDLAQLKHCSVGLRRLTDIDNLATFCMTHQLYNCFCGGDSTEGKPVVIEKEQWNTTVAHFNPDLAVRAHYSFERQTEELPAKKKGGKEKKLKGKTELKPKIESDSDIPKSEKKEPKTDTKEDLKSREKANLFGDECPIQRSIELDTIFSYFRSRPHICRRAISVPKNSYQRLNQRRAERVRHYIERQETPETRELLMSRISGAITHYRKEIDRQRKRELGRKQVGINVPPVIEVRDDSDGSEVSSLLLKRSAEKSTKGQKPSKRMKLQVEESPAPAPEPQSPRKSDIQVPRIAACYSLNAASVDVLGSGMTNNASAVAMSVNSTNETDSPKFRSFYNEVVKNMNTLVSKKMQDIDLALQRESKIIPVPNEEILCIIKWTNFLAAFESGFVYIWIVQMKTHNFLAATITNQMPTVCGAIGVVNTRFATDQRSLPLMASLLIEGKRNENTNRLAVVMQGRKSYWLVKGFLRLMEGNACTKPTPQTHPLLTRKINVLCSLLVKQRVREHQRKVQPGGGEASSSTCTSPVPEAQRLPNKRKLKAAPGGGASDAEPQRAEATSSSTAVAPSRPTPPPPVAPPSASRKTSTLGISNIEFRKVSHSDVDELQIPELHDYDHRWVVLDIFDDFSHIFVPACGDMISLTRIHTVMRMSAESQKVVRLQFFPNAPYDAFVTPSSKKKIYFGPLHLDMPPPVLLLLQSVDRKMMTREAYQKDHGIPVQRHRRSMAFWVLHLNGQVHFEIEDESTPKLEATQPIKIPSHLSVEISNKVEKQTTNSFPPVVIIDSDEEEEEEEEDDDDQLVAGQLVDTDEQPTVTQIKQEHPRMNFTIQTVPTSGALQITAAEAVAPPPSSPPKDVTTCQLSGGFMPFISKVPAKEGEPSANTTTTQYLTPQVQLTKSLLNAATSSSSAAHPPAAKISRPSAPLNKINESLQELLSSGNTVTPGGITITKLDNCRDTKMGCQQNNETIVKIGSKRTMSGMAKQPASKAMPSVLKGASAGTSILRKPGTTATVKATPPAQQSRQQQHPGAQPTAGVKLYPRPSVQGQRQSMPAIASPIVKSVGPRQTLPTKPMAASSVGQRKSLPTKPMAASSVSTPKLPVAGTIEPSSRLSLPNTKLLTTGERQSLPVKVASKPAVRPDQASPTTTQRAKGTDCSYGVIGAKGLPRYRVKVIGSDIIVKIPDHEVVHFKSFMAASGFLNR